MRIKIIYYIKSYTKQKWTRLTGKNTTGTIRTEQIRTGNEKLPLPISKLWQSAVQQCCYNVYQIETYKK